MARNAATDHLTPTEHLDAWVVSQMGHYRIPGLVIGVFREGVAEFVKAYGSADLEHDVPMTRHSVCEICSITKQFAAAALLLLQEDGRLSLDDPASKYLPQMPAAWRAVTLSDLLTHTSGITDAFFDLHEPALTADALARAAEAPGFGRREGWDYSNLGYRLLGDVIEAVAGQDVFEFFRERIFQPLGLEQTRPNTPDIVPHRVRGYGLRDGKLVNAPPLDANTGGAAGGLISTVDDLNRWSEALHRGELLTPKSREAMLTPARLAGGEVARPPSSRGGYGLGVNVLEVSGHRVEKHAGGWDDASAQLTRLLDDHVTVAILTNFGGWSMRPWIGEIAASFFVPGFHPAGPVAGADPAPNRKQTLRAVFDELAAGTVTGRCAAPRLAAILNRHPAEWRAELAAIDLDAARFAERIPQGKREMVIYRIEGDPPTAVAAGFASDGRADYVSIGPLPG